MFEAFVPDLRNEFPGSDEWLHHYPGQLQQLRQQHVVRVNRRFQEVPAATVAAERVLSAADSAA